MRRAQFPCCAKARIRERSLDHLQLHARPTRGYSVGVPSGGYWRELLNSDGKEYGGSGVGNSGGVEAKAEPVHGRPFSLTLTLPPLGALFLKGPV